MPEEFSEPTSSSVEDVVDSLFKQSDAAEVVEEDQVEIEDQEQVEEVEAVENEAEVSDDQAADDETEEASSETTDDEMYVEIEGEEVSLAQLKEWRTGGMKAKDYTEKTQAVQAERREVETQRIALEQAHQTLSTERQQLQDALASLSIETEQEPNWSELAGKISPQDYQKRQAEWQQRQAKKRQAIAAHEALQTQQYQQVAQRETAALMEKKPEWVDPSVRAETLAKMQAVGGEFGITPDEVAAITDHRMLLVMDELISLRGQKAVVDEAKNAVSKRVIKAEPRRRPSAKTSTADAESKVLKQKRSKFNKSRKVDDAVDLLWAQNNS